MSAQTLLYVCIWKAINRIVGFGKIFIGFYVGMSQITSLDDDILLCTIYSMQVCSQPFIEFPFFFFSFDGNLKS